MHLCIWLIMLDSWFTDDNNVHLPQPAQSPDPQYYSATSGYSGVSCEQPFPIIIITDGTSPCSARRMAPNATQDNPGSVCIHFTTHHCRFVCQRRTLGKCTFHCSNYSVQPLDLSTPSSFGNWSKSILDSKQLHMKPCETVLC